MWGEKYLSSGHMIKKPLQSSQLSGGGCTVTLSSWRNKRSQAWVGQTESAWTQRCNLLNFCSLIQQHFIGCRKRPRAVTAAIIITVITVIVITTIRKGFFLIFLPGILQNLAYFGSKKLPHCGFNLNFWHLIFYLILTYYICHVRTFMHKLRHFGWMNKMTGEHLTTHDHRNRVSLERVKRSANWVSSTESPSDARHRHRFAPAQRWAACKSCPVPAALLSLWQLGEVHP